MSKKKLDLVVEMLRQYKLMNLSEPLKEESRAIVWRKAGWISFKLSDWKDCLTIRILRCEMVIGGIFRRDYAGADNCFSLHFQRNDGGNEGLLGQWARTLQGRQQRPPPAQEHPRESGWSSWQSPASLQIWTEGRSSSCLPEKKVKQDEKFTR